jgi:hypothetical protein
MMTMSNTLSNDLVRVLVPSELHAVSGGKARLSAAERYYRSQANVYGSPYYRPSSGFSYSGEPET